MPLQRGSFEPGRLTYFERKIFLGRRTINRPNAADNVSSG
jgi:hypothetical protein